jgi:hypothetical protein
MGSHFSAVQSYERNWQLHPVSGNKCRISRGWDLVHLALKNWGSLCCLIQNLLDSIWPTTPFLSMVKRKNEDPQVKCFFETKWTIVLRDTKKEIQTLFAKIMLFQAGAGITCPLPALHRRSTSLWEEFPCCWAPTVRANWLYETHWTILDLSELTACEQNRMIDKISL